jgi:hypothetical protein
MSTACKHAKQQTAENVNTHLHHAHHRRAGDLHADLHLPRAAAAGDHGARRRAAAGAELADHVGEEVPHQRAAVRGVLAEQRGDQVWGGPVQQRWAGPGWGSEPPQGQE